MKQTIKVGLIAASPLALIFVYQSFLQNLNQERFNTPLNVLAQILMPIIFFFVLKNYVVKYDPKRKGFQSVKNMLFYGLKVDAVMALLLGLTTGLSTIVSSNMRNSELKFLFQPNIILPILVVSFYLALLIFVFFIIELIVAYTLLIFYLRLKRR